MIKTKKISLLVCLAIGLLMRPANTVAQSETTLREDQKSAILLDLRVGKLMEEFIAAGFQKDSLGGIKLSGPFENVSVSQIERVYGGTSLPKDLTTLSQILADPRLEDFPVFSSIALQGLTNGCFVQIKLVDKAVADEVEARWKKRSPKISMGKFSYAISWGQEEDKVFFARRIDDTTLELGTKSYLQQANRSFFTDRLNAAYKSSPDHALRLIFDLDTRREILKEIVKLEKKEVPRTAHAYLGLVESLKSVTLTFSFDTENLMSLIAEANDKSSAEEFADGIDSLLQIGKIGFGPVYKQMAQGVPESARQPLAMVKGMIDELATDRSDATVKLLVKKPENFVAMLGQFSKSSERQLAVATRQNGIQQAARAVGRYAEKKKHMPFKADPERAHQTISWRVKLLPFMSKLRLSRQMDMKVSAKVLNRKFADKMPPNFGFGGKQATVLWIESEVDSLADVKDGAANTVMLIETPQGRPWIENKPLSVDEAVAMVKGLGDGQELFVALYDGTVSKVSNQIAEETLRNLFRPNDGNVIDGSWKK